MRPLQFGWRNPNAIEPPPYLDEEAKKTHPIDPPSRERSYWGRQAIEYLDRIYTYDNLFSVDSIVYYETEAPWANSVGDFETAQIKKRLAETKRHRAEHIRRAKEARIEAEVEAEVQKIASRESQRIRTTTSPAHYILALRQRPGLLYVDLELCSRILCELWEICARGVKHPDQQIGRKITKAEFLKWLEGPDN